jgi:hypothetical protein
MVKQKYTVKEKVEIKSECSLIISQLLATRRKGLFPMVKVLGHPGTGKSGACIRLGELLNFRLHGELSFDPYYVIDSIEKLIEIVVETKSEDKRVVVIEELSTLLNNRRFMGRDNVAANNLFDTMRKKGMFIIANYPINKTVDSHTERMFNIYIEVVNLDVNNHIYFLRSHILQTNVNSGKTYHHSFKNNKGFDVSYFKLKWGNKETFDKYDSNKDKFMTQLYTKMLASKRVEIQKENKKLNRISDVLTDKQQAVMESYARGLSTKEISEINNVTTASICASRRSAIIKGYSVAEFKAKVELE